MKIGCVTEIKNNENRVGLTPNAVKSYALAGHTVFIQKGAGLGSFIVDADYIKAGAQILDTADAVWQQSDMIVKVKEPLAEEYPKMREGQIVYTYFHFAADEELTKACMERKIIAVAYETVEENGILPLLKPMSEVAGRMAPLMGTYFLALPQGGRGFLPTGVTGVPFGKVVVLGGGTVGANAAKIAAGIGAKVTILDISFPRLEHLGEVMPANVDPIFSDPQNVETYVCEADMVIGAVLIPGAVAPKLITRDLVKRMKPGSVLVDVAIDQGGCAETSHATTHSDPVYVVDNVIHYCVANMPGAFATTSTVALNNATIRYGLMIADKGVQKACKENAALKAGLNMYKGAITFKAVAEAFNLLDNYTEVDSVL